ncbi:MAG: VWA domain-containing protein [Cocleimonas sp.]|nr:VWA domain-containing protein [Cocleimonas sp.]
MSGFFNNFFNSQLEFAFIWAFLLLPLPIIVRFLFPSVPVSGTAALRVPFFKSLHTGLKSRKKSRSLTCLFLALIAWMLLVTAAARPQFVGDTVKQSITGRSLMMAVDISGSMQADDMVINNRSVTRLTAVKAVATDFIRKRKGDRIGLILFGSQAYLQAPLTFDRKTVNILLGESALGLAGRETAIGDAIGLAVKRLRKEDEKNRVLILLTDGANTAGNVDPLKAADLAAQEKVKIYAIGVGADERIIQTPFGRQRVGGTDLDEPTLEAIAQKTNGRYFRARDVEGLLKIYSVLDEIEPISKDELSYRPVKELYYYPLALALFFSAFVALFGVVANLFNSPQLRRQTR